VAIAEGAHFRGSVDMQRKGGQPSQAKGDSSQVQQSRSSASTVGSQPIAAH
jgi:hypothetical protein